MLESIEFYIDSLAFLFRRLINGKFVEIEFDSIARDEEKKTKICLMAKHFIIHCFNFRMMGP